MSQKPNTLTIDGREIPFEAGQTLMQAALAAGVDIPRLCFHKEVSNFGSCKLCTVRVNGRQVSACTFPAEAGQTVDNDTEELRHLRLNLIQLLFVEGNHFCPSCEQSGNCQLQAAAYELGMTESHFQHLYPRRPIDASHPEIMLDQDRCILCGLCVRASRELDGKNVFSIAGRGGHAHLQVNCSSGKLADSELSGSDRAATICPVGALIAKDSAYRTPIGQRPYDRPKAARQPEADALSTAEQEN